MQQVAEGHFGALAHEHLGPAHLPGLDADRNLVIEANRARGHFCGSDVARHDLGQAGRGHALIGIVFDDHTAAVRIDEQVGGGGDLRGRWDQAWGGDGYGCGRGQEGNDGHRVAQPEDEPGDRGRGGQSKHHEALKWRWSEHPGAWRWPQSAKGVGLERRADCTTLSLAPGPARRLRAARAL